MFSFPSGSIIFSLSNNIKMLLCHCNYFSEVDVAFSVHNCDRNLNLNLCISNDDNDGDAEWWFVLKSRDIIFRIRSLRGNHILLNVISSIHDPRRQSNWFRLKGAANIFLRIALHGLQCACTSRSCAARWTGRSFRSAESRMLARSTRFRHRGSWLLDPRAAGWQLAPKKHRKTSRPVITVAPALSSHYQRALARCINPNTFFRVVCFVNSRRVAQIFVHAFRSKIYLHANLSLYRKRFI